MAELAQESDQKSKFRYKNRFKFAASLPRVDRRDRWSRRRYLYYNDKVENQFLYKRRVCIIGVACHGKLDTYTIEGENIEEIKSVR